MLAKVLVPAALALTLTSGTALACGAFVQDVLEGAVSMDAQRAVYHAEGSRLKVTVQVTGSAPSPKFAWVVPVPPDDTLALSVTQPAIFEELDALTQPQIYLSQGSASDEGGCGCGAADSKAGGDGIRQSNDVDVFDAGQVGEYEYAVVGADSAESITQWLDTNGYRVEGDVSAALQPYIDGGMRFVAVKFNNTAIASGEFGGQPLVLDMARPETLMYPLALSRLSVTQTVPVLLYVIADARHETSFNNADLSTVAGKARQLSDASGAAATYNESVDALTAEAGGALFITDYSQTFTGDCGDACPTLSALGVEDKRITRLYGNVPAAALADLTLPMGPTETVDNVQFAAARTSDSLDVGWAIAPLFLLLGGPLRRRRHS